MSMIKRKMRLCETVMVIFEFTQKLFTSRKPANPFTPVSVKQVASDLAESRQQIAEGKGLNMEAALNELGRNHGFL